MLRSVFTKTIRDQRRALFWWSVGLLILVLITFSSYPAIRDTPELSRMLENLPEAVRALLGELDFLSPAGYVNGRLFMFVVPLLFLIYAIGMGTAAIAGEEESGTLDLLLANPQSRTRVVIEKFLGLVTVLSVLGFVFWLQLWAGAMLVDIEIGARQLLAATVSAVLLAFVFGSLALALSCATGRRGLSLGVAAAVALGSYLLNTLAVLADWLEPYRELSAFYYYIGNDPVRNGVDPLHAMVLVTATVALVFIGVLSFQRRDLSV